MGYLWATGSVLLVSVAQLSLKWAMMQFPPLAWNRGFLSALQTSTSGLLVLLGGLCAYALSMCCWYLALRRLPLSKVYPLLSLSYVLVGIFALCLPWLQEGFSLAKLAGLLTVVAGLVLICRR
nr:4-amino-4-deoxy-L-arabinose-phosphoundecaprenol flippase subunit ArnF [[Erwinia] mediterraneensis]